MANLSQKIARKEAELARLKDQSRKLENGQKIIIGGMILSIARKNPERAKVMLNDIKTNVTKKADLDRLQPVIDELETLANQQTDMKTYPV